MAPLAEGASLSSRVGRVCIGIALVIVGTGDRKSTRLNSSHSQISYAVFCLKKKKQTDRVYWAAKHFYSYTLVIVHFFPIRVGANSVFCHYLTTLHTFFHVLNDFRTTVMIA